VFRAPSAVVGLLVGGVLAAVLLGDAAIRAGIGPALLLAPWILLVLWGVYALIFAPHVRIDSDGIRIHNLLRVIDVPWGRVTEIDMRWQLQVHTDEPRRYKAYGGPVAGRPGRPPVRRDADRDRREPPAIRDLVLIQEAWFAAQDRGEGEGDVRRRWDAPSLISLALIGAWVIIALFSSGVVG